MIKLWEIPEKSQESGDFLLFSPYMDGFVSLDILLVLKKHRRNENSGQGVVKGAVRRLLYKLHGETIVKGIGSPIF